MRNERGNRLSELNRESFDFSFCLTWMKSGGSTLKTAAASNCGFSYSRVRKVAAAVSASNSSSRHKTSTRQNKETYLKNLSWAVKCVFSLRLKRVGHIWRVRRREASVWLLSSLQGSLGFFLLLTSSNNQQATNVDARASHMLSLRNIR